MAIAHYNPPASSANVEKKGVLTGLRALLAEKFPQAPNTSQKARYSVPLAEGSAPVELPLGVVTEFTGSLATGGLFIEALLRTTYARRGMMALVDARGSFDPGSLWSNQRSWRRAERAAPSEYEAEERLERLLWVACQNVGSTIKAADLLLRDGNLSTIVLDLQMTPLAELRRIPANTWYRFQRIVEPTEMLFIVLTPLPMVSSAAERWELRGEWSLSAMREVRAELPVPLQRRGRGLQATENTREFAARREIA